MESQADALNQLTTDDLEGKVACLFYFSIYFAGAFSFFLPFLIWVFDAENVWENYSKKFRCKTVLSNNKKGLLRGCFTGIFG